jgi:hypothetical protein
MSEAAPQAAEGTSTADIEKALDVLRLRWGAGYVFGYDREHGCFWVIKSGNLGSLLTAPAAEELGDKLDGGELGTANAPRRP